jgi:hypothetical protein
MAPVVIPLQAAADRLDLRELGDPRALRVGKLEEDDLLRQEHASRARGDQQTQRTPDSAMQAKPVKLKNENLAE